MRSQRLVLVNSWLVGQPAQSQEMASFSGRALHDDLYGYLIADTPLHVAPYLLLLQPLTTHSGFQCIDGHTITLGYLRPRAYRIPHRTCTTSFWIKTARWPPFAPPAFLVLVICLLTHRAYFLSGNWPHVSFVRRQYLCTIILSHSRLASPHNQSHPHHICTFHSRSVPPTRAQSPHLPVYSRPHPNPA